MTLHASASGLEDQSIISLISHNQCYLYIPWKINQWNRKPVGEGGVRWDEEKQAEKKPDENKP